MSLMQRAPTRVKYRYRAHVGVPLDTVVSSPLLQNYVAGGISDLGATVAEIYAPKISPTISTSATIRPGSNRNLLIRGPVTLAEGVSLYSANDAGNALAPLQIAASDMLVQSVLRLTPLNIVPIAPVGNTFRPTHGAFDARMTNNGSGRTFVGNFGVQTQAPRADLSDPDTDAAVGIYVGAVASTNGDVGAFKPDLWAVNTVTAMLGGSGIYNARGYELDFNNFNGPRGDEGLKLNLTNGPCAIGMHVLGDPSAFISSAAFVVDNIYNAGVTNQPIWHGGYGVGPRAPVKTSSFFDYGTAINVLESTEAHTFGLKMTGALTQNIVNGPLTLGAAISPTTTLDVIGTALFHPENDANLRLRGHVGLSDGVSLYATNDANNALKGLELSGSSIRLTGSVATTASLTVGGAGTVNGQLTAHPGTNQNALIRGNFTLGTGVSLYSANDAGNALLGLELAGSSIYMNGPTRFGADRINIVLPYTPASSAAAGTQGDHAWDANFMYVCVAANSWKRTALAAF